MSYLPGNWLAVSGSLDRVAERLKAAFGRNKSASKAAISRPALQSPVRGNVEPEVGA